MLNLKWLLSEQSQYLNGDPLAYENISVPFAIILGDPHGLERIRDARRLENDVIEKVLPAYILAEPGMGAWIFDPNVNEARLREDEPPDCPEDKRDMELFLRLDINWIERERNEAFQSFQDYTDNDIDPNLVELQFKLWSIRYRIPLVGCDLGLHEKLPPSPTNEAREEKMGEIICEYARRSSKPIVAIVGSSHTETASRIHSILRQENVGYLIFRY